MKKQALVLLLAILPWITFAQKNYPDLLENYLQAHVTVHNFSGAVLVAKKGKVIYQKAFGLANREWNIPNTVNTKFQIGSITKQFTAAAILQLEEQGKLKIEDKLSKYFPGYPKGDSVTLHMLLNHTSGIKEMSAHPHFSEINPNISIANLKDTLLNLFKNEPYDFSPGTFWRYSNSGYILLGYIIEQVSGQTYRDYLYNNVLLKAGMTNTDMNYQDRIVPSLAEGYIISAGGWKKSAILSVNVAFSAGGLYSTVGDLLKWNDALKAGKIISKESLARMNRPNAGDRGTGYGVFVDTFFERQAIFHSGNIPGYSSFIIRYPAEEITIINLTNRETNLDFMHRGMAGILFDRAILLPYKRKPVTINTSLLQHYIGVFEGPALPYPLTIVEKDKKLYLRLNRDIELTPESQTRFYINEPDVDIQIEYVLNAGKEVTKVNYFEGGIKSEAKRKAG